MQQEVNSLLDNGTWTLVDLHEGRRVVNSRWVYKVKTDHLGQVERFKARFVAKGCSQRQGVDYTKTFSPVIRMASLRVMLLALQWTLTSVLWTSTPPSCMPNSNMSSLSDNPWVSPMGRRGSATSSAVFIMA
jgi:hypothetical protein